MRNLIFIFFSCLFLNLICGQNNSNLIENWDAVVDHSNVIATKCYIEELIKSESLKEIDNEYYTNVLKQKLSSSSIKTPIPFDTLHVFLKPQFEQTLNKFSFKINETKNGPKKLDSLFVSLEAVFKDVKQPDLINTEPINKLREDISDYLAPKTPKTPEAAHVVAENSFSVERIPERRNAILTLLNILIAILFIFSIFLIRRSYMRGKKIESLKEQVKDLKTALNKKPENNNKINPYESQNKNLKSKIAELNEELKEAKQISHQNFDRSFDFVENQGSNTKTWDTPKPIEVKPILTSFYAGKPDPNRTFPQTTQDILEQETVYKFNYIDNTKIIAEFQVVLVSDFMKRQIVNSPDDFLYRVCNNANSNQEFQRDIITERKGIARLIDGDWIVDENDKAFIKFQ